MTMPQQQQAIAVPTYDRLLRLPQIIGDPKATPPVPPLIPVSRASFWAGVAQGKYPKSIKLGPKTTCWRESEILACIAIAGK
jgi:predicted DNA-binding transcriptional regulator AlpA